MKLIKPIVVTLLAIPFCGCTELYDIYIRNNTSQLGIFDVFLLDKSGIDVLPDNVILLNRAVDFDKKFIKDNWSRQPINWVDTGHFKIQIQPQTTICLTEMERAFRNHYGSGSPKITVTLTAQNKIDTLMEKSSFFSRFERFKFTPHGPFSPTNYYFDVSTTVEKAVVRND